TTRLIQLRKAFSGWLLTRFRPTLMTCSSQSQRTSAHISVHISPASRPGSWRSLARTATEMKRLRNIGRLFTGTPEGVVEDAAVILDGEMIAWCGKHGEEPHELLESVIDDHDCAGGLV